MAEDSSLYAYPDFTSNQNTGGGGPPFNAPAYRPAEPPSNLKIYLISEDVDLEFFEEGVSIGYGKSVDIIYNSSLQFNGPKTYTANLDNGKVISKFIINTKPLQYASGVIDGIGVTEYTLVDDVFEEQQTQNFNFGTISLRFKTETLQRGATPTQPAPADVVTIDNPLVGYEVLFDSNIRELTILSLQYQLVFEGNIVLDGVVKLAENAVGFIPKNVLDNGVVNFEIKGNLPDGIFIKNIYSGTTQQFGLDALNYDRLTKQNYAFQLPATLLNAGLGVVIEAEKEIKSDSPIVVLNQIQYNVNVKDSDTEKAIVIPFNTEYADSVLVYLSADKVLEIPAVNKEVTLFFQKDFNEVYGSKKIFFVPRSTTFGTGTRVEAIVTFIAINDFPAITEVIYVESIDVPTFSDYNIEYDVSYSSFAASSIDITLKQRDGSRIALFSNQPPNGSVKINLKKLKENYPNWTGSDNVTLVLKPYNRGGAEELIGNDYEVLTKLTLPTISLNEDIITNALFNAFSEKLKIDEPTKESKYLTHLANFGNDEQIIISSWETDDFTLSKKSTDNLGNTFVAPNDVVNSIILKLYSPLPANTQNNSTFWITKLMSNPLIETVVLIESDDVSCPSIKGPNFTIDIDFVKGQSTNYESLDNIILSGSATSNQLVSLYVSSSLVNTDELNIEYASSSTYLWDNFVHFSSATERINNFVYKVQLIEVYETAISASNAVGQVHSGSLSSTQEAERQQSKKNQLINGFDGFEKFLYEPSSLGWPYNGIIRRLSTSNEVTNWYDNIIEYATIYDNNNSNYVLNNIPQYIVNNSENESLLLFFAMIGHHFDNIYFHTKGIEKSRGLGYKAKDGISDKLLFDTLKSFSWDAKNLAADADLWSYVFGKDSDGNDKESNPSKQRTNEVWRRIVNNLPYLLKHKGTRRGIHALMACYGIPSSNLSILEFGGPEINGTSKSKLVIDNITTGLNMVSGSKIQMEWKDTDKVRKPNTIELFVKVEDSAEYTLISGSNWGVNLSGSTNTNFGQVVFNYSGSNSISTTSLPIFNGDFFGVSVSSGSNGLKLDVRQSNKERTIFQQSVSASSVETLWNTGNTLQIGGNYTGSLDEFRLWSEVLDSERFFEHVSFPEMINGNSISSSTSDLYFRLDFEYPKNLAQTPSLINVDTNIYFESGLTRNDYENGSTASLYSVNLSPLLSASAVDFPSISGYPFQFEVIDRTIVMDYPDGGASRFSTNKVRFESQTDFNGNDVSGGINLSIKNRVTKKAFDQSPTDSNRVGLFFSPTKELNMDIAKTFGGLNIDNYIGDPSDDYKPNYKSLDGLRNYYFERFDNRDIYSYINLIKLYEKSMFEDLKKMLPARVKATTGLLIEPHFLERSKVVHKKPTADDYQRETEIKLSDTSLISFEDIQKETVIDANLSEKLVAENNQYEALITTASVDSLFAENYQKDSIIDMNSNFIFNSEAYQKEVVIDAELGEPTIVTEIDIINSNQIIGQTEFESIGFGIYSQNGNAIRTYFDKDNRRVKERIRVQLVTEQKERIIQKFAVTASVNGLGDPRRGFVSDIQTYTETKLNIQPFSGSVVPNVGGNIIEVKNVDGYLSTHYRNTNDLTRGLQNSFFRGSKNTSATTLDGSSPVETFISNPNTLRVNKTGRDSSEPILEVE